MAQRGIEPEKVTKPIQLVATWFAALVLLVGAFLGAATTARRPAWIPVLFGMAAVLAVPFFALFVFRLQTKYRPELQEDPYYSKYVADEEQLRNFQPENLSGAKNGTISEPTTKETASMEAIRDKIYEQHRGLFLIHTWRPSQVPGQVADISIRLHEHGKRWTPLSDGVVERVEYYLGSYFFGGNSVIKTNAKEAFRLDISSYGTTDCVARVYFKDGTPPAILDRYLDYALPQ
jgi:hypothetical protein